MNKKPRTNVEPQTESELFFGNLSAPQLTALFRVAGLAAFWFTARSSWAGINIARSPVIILIGLCFVHIYFRFSRKSLRLMQLALFFEYFCVLFLGYYQAELAYAEYIFFPIILCDIFLIVERKPMLVILPLSGIFGCTLLSSSYVSHKVVSSSFIHAELSWISFPFYAFITLGLLALSIVREKQKKVVMSLKDKINVNRKLETINRTLSQKLFIIKQDSILEERKQITHEIHDTAGYVFVNVIMMLQATLAVLNRNDTAKAAEMLENALDYSRRGMNEIRYILQEIRAREEPTLGLQKNFYEIASSFYKATEVKIRLEYGNWPKSFNSKLDTFYLSFFREALTNSLKHGNATEVELVCWKTEQDAIITVEDNGTGLSGPIKYGIGISSITDLAQSLGGNVAIGTVHGFSISVTIPLASIARMDEDTFLSPSGTLDSTENLK